LEVCYLIKSSSDNRDDLYSEILEFESTNSRSIDRPPQPLDRTNLTQEIDLLTNSSNLPVDGRSGRTIAAIFDETSNRASGEATAIAKSHLGNENLVTIESPEENLEIEAELDALLASLQLATPQAPQLARAGDANSLADILTHISTTEPVTHTQQLLQELNTARSQLKIAGTELQILHQRNQVQVDLVDANTLQVKQLKFRTQQLAQHSQKRVEAVRQMLGSITQIRTEIVTNLNKFGGYEEIVGMLVQLEAARYALVIAHDRVTTGQEAFYDSLQAIQVQVAARSHESEQKMQRYQELIQTLWQTISTDRLRVAGMSVELSTKIDDLNGLSTQITTMHGQIVDKSQTLQSKIEQIDRAFVELSTSVREEKDQFYALTVETIEKADTIGSQLVQLIQQINSDRVKLAEIEAAVAAMHQNASQVAERQLASFELHDRELISLASNFQIDRKQHLLTVRKLTTWLWILSVAVGMLSLLSFRMSLGLN
jgi:predicted  nucleic acid-binding Zn-ribbon protein